MREQIKLASEHAALFTEYINIIRERSDSAPVDKLAEKRGFKPETLKELGIFYVDSPAELVHPKYIDFLESFGITEKGNPVFRKRWIFPIHGISGKVKGLVGYSGDSDIRYLYATSRYYSRASLYGLENMRYATDAKIAIITEGITDTVRLRGLGYKNVFAMCGTRRQVRTEWLLRNIAVKGVLVIPDTDRAGRSAERIWRFKNKLTLWLPPSRDWKDLDELCKAGHSSILCEYIDYALTLLSDREFPVEDGRIQML